MFDPDTVLPLALQELASRDSDIAACDRMRCSDTIGPCTACPIGLDTTRAGIDEES
jgi:hypothetical protein